MTDYSKASSAPIDTPENYSFDTIPTKARGLEVEWVYPEFQSLCPLSERHDQGTLTIRYSPRAKLLESKSARDYLRLWRNMKIWQEHVTDEIATALYAALDPEWLLVEIEWTARGGIFAKTTARRGEFPS
ncbi:MAG: NADPH-dependent 7-cyano-7-deazaguanine reductase QueF [Spirochaetes bacterium]|nr:NADPH-dependent 7-cyano-7-deazaguanine reductase QueF [Spirochaetota bacterium]